MGQGNFETEGWIVTAERINGRSGKRHYLVAILDEDAALSAAKKLFGREFRVVIGGQAAAIHFTRRSIQAGDIFELGARSQRQT